MIELTREDEARAEQYAAMLNGQLVTALLRTVRGELVRMLPVAVARPSR